MILLFSRGMRSKLLINFKNSFFRITVQEELSNPAFIIKKVAVEDGDSFIGPDGNLISYTLKCSANSYEPPRAANLAAT